MKAVIIILIPILFFASCSKDRKEKDCNHLFYKELPNVLLIPGSSNSTVSYPIYLSNDTTEKIVCKIYSGTWWPSHWEVPFNQYSLEGSDVVDILVNDNVFNPCISPVTESSYISSNSIEPADNEIFNDGNMIFCNTFLDTNFIGFRIKRGQSYHYGWLRGYINYAYPPLLGARFFDCCYNECSDVPILVGLKPVK